MGQKPSKPKQTPSQEQTPVPATVPTSTPVPNQELAATIATAQTPPPKQFCKCGGLAELCKPDILQKMTDAEAKVAVTKIINANCGFCKNPQQNAAGKIIYPNENSSFSNIESFGNIMMTPTNKKIFVGVLFIILIIIIYLVMRQRKELFGM